MPKIDELRESKFLQKADVGRGLLVTVRSCEQFDVAMEGGEEHLKWALTFKETGKPFVLGPVNATIIAGILGSEDTDDWIGGSIVLYVDPAVMFKGKVVGGIRARAPKPGSVAAKPKPAPAVADFDDSEIPF